MFFRLSNSEKGFSKNTLTHRDYILMVAHQLLQLSKEAMPTLRSSGGSITTSHHTLKPNKSHPMYANAKSSQRVRLRCKVCSLVHANQASSPGRKKAGGGRQQPNKTGYHCAECSSAGNAIVPVCGTNANGNACYDLHVKEGFAQFCYEEKQPVARD